jgi:hypothetical protein
MNAALIPTASEIAIGVWIFGMAIVVFFNG